MKLRSGRSAPACFRTAAQLDVSYRPDQIDRRAAFLINPFYAKDRHASYGKHVLTPTLALTSIAASTPPHWRVSYWDENLLQGAPPVDPFPAVVGITVHLTFAERAYELARWFRERGAFDVGVTTSIGIRAMLQEVVFVYFNLATTP